MQTPTPVALQDVSLVESWEGTRHPEHHHGPVWFSVAGSLAAALIVYGIVSGGWTLSVLVALMIGMHLWVGRQGPARMHRLAIAKEGMLYDGVFIRWNDVEGFWTAPSSQSIDLHILTRSTKTPEVRQQIRPEDAEHARLLLSQYTTELHEHRERLIDIFTRLCKL